MGLILDVFTVRWLVALMLFVWMVVYSNNSMIERLDE
jgi:hypothetical protein